MDRLKNIRFVLSNTSHPGNIGAAARAMKVMGMENLHLINPTDYPSAEATARASGADDVLYAATVHDDLDQSIEPCTLVMGTSARNRGMDIEVIDLHQAAKMLTLAAKSQQVALIFGKERYGMTNEEMQRCHYLVKLPANPEYSSLNLAAAIQVAAYELRMRCLEAQNIEVIDQPADVPFATAEKMQSFYQHLFQIMHDIDFMHTENQKSLEEKLRMMFNRLRIEKHEMDILRGFLSAVNKNIKK
ncbi:RNA methyltransferase [Marinicella litoralis]|uniref:tRNA (cytidine/uridine-2'-O-)-methyltransferase TrmJ n=1 Tax=Marinicella litoralis TaxID=644220 RepID=A0A4V3DIK3_9GAMM|nr:RNA methyltransferase [Marinicella litoralis]TDR22461.1 tRNA (cytidine32/uridine32-2'-O)-methyltransferase [Marinicella litoralis]